MHRGRNAKLLRVSKHGHIAVKGDLRWDPQQVDNARKQEAKGGEYENVRI
jgi:hypothetical protein